MRIDGEEYEKVKQDGSISLVVLDKGFIFVGELEAVGGEYRLSNCKNVRKWAKGGIGGLSLGAVSSQATMDPHADISFLPSRFVYTCRLEEGWETS